MIDKNQKVIGLWCKVLNEVENDAGFLRGVDRDAEKAARMAAFQMRETKIREEVLRRMQEKAWTNLDSDMHDIAAKEPED